MELQSIRKMNKYYPNFDHWIFIIFLNFEKTLRLPFGQKVILNLPTSSKATTTEKESERESLASINSIQSINVCITYWQEGGL